MLALRKTLAKKTKTISLVGEKDISSKSKGGRSPVPSSPWEVSMAIEEDIKSLVVGGFLAPKELQGTSVPWAKTSLHLILARS